MVAEDAETSEQQQEGGVSKKAAKTAKGTKGGKVAATAAVAAVAASVTATPKMPDPTEIIQAALAASQRQLGQQAQAGSGVSFAEMNAVPISTGGRRRPGANMTGFLDMAKTMRTSR
jgi:N-acetylmuramoyl-L-alanine amidase CwlA